MLNNKKLTVQELLLFDNITFSLCEEVDIFYSRVSNLAFAE